MSTTVSQPSTVEQALEAIPAASSTDLPPTLPQNW